MEDGTRSLEVFYRVSLCKCDKWRRLIALMIVDLENATNVNFKCSSQYISSIIQDAYMHEHFFIHQKSGNMLSIMFESVRVVEKQTNTENFSEY